MTIVPDAWLGVAALAAAMAGASALSAQTAVPAGSALFQQRCAGCHSLERGRSGAGPSLAGVVGRKAASAAGFSYSAALLKSGLTWTPGQLDQFLAAPQKTVPGTRMPIAVGDPVQRKIIVDFLGASR